MSFKSRTRVSPSMSTKDFIDREVKYAPLNLETVSCEGVFEGYASLFDTVDLSKDVVRKGAFAKGINSKTPLSVKMLYQHNPCEPIGVWQTIKEDHKGLFVKGKLLTEIQRAKEVLSLMKQGALDGLSIGYKTIRSQKKNLSKTANALHGQQPVASRQGLVRELLEIDLYEISIVTFPMHPDARVDKVKSLDISSGYPTIRDFERWLMRDAGFTRKQAQTAIAKGFKSLAFTREAEATSDQKKQMPLSEKLLKAAQKFA